MPTMILPTIHLNGSSPEHMLTDLMAAMDAVHTAIDTFARTAPHGRDYYPQGDLAFPQARAEYEKHLKALWLVREYLTAVGTHIAMAQEVRSKPR